MFWHSYSNLWWLSFIFTNAGYITYTEEIIQAVCTGKANVKEFPFVEEPKTAAKRGAREQGKPKLIVFIIGGVTMAEIRAAHELSEKLQYIFYIYFECWKF